MSSIDNVSTSSVSDAPEGILVNLDQLEQLIEQELGKPSTFQFENSTLDDVLDHFRKLARLHMYIDWVALKTVGIDSDFPVNLVLHGLPARQALGFVLREVSVQSVEDPINYTVHNGCVWISTHSKIMQLRSYRVYNIRDLLEGKSAISTKDGQGEYETRLRKIIALVQDIGPHEEWAGNNDDASTIREWEGCLIIRTRSCYQRAIRSLLVQLRKLPVSSSSSFLPRAEDQTTKKQKVEACVADRAEDPPKKLSPSRVKAKALYEWATEVIPGAAHMTNVQLFDEVRKLLKMKAEQTSGEEGKKLEELLQSLPTNADAFGKYLRDAGIKRYDTRGNPTPTRSILRSDQV